MRDFLNAAVRSLASLPFERLDTEVRVLRTEGQRRGGSLGLAAPTGMRFGPVAYGVVDAPELGLRTVTPERVDAWRRRWFTRDNAALWLSGPPPHGIDLSPLPRGERIPPPAAEPCPYRWPVWYPGFDAYIAVSLLAPHSMALWAAHAILHERLYDRLRTREGRSYKVSGQLRPVVRGHRDDLRLDRRAARGDRERARRSVRRAAQAGRAGAADEELDEVRRLRERGSREPHFGATLASARDRRARGRRARPREEEDAELAALGGADVGAALREALDAALWLVPVHIGMEDKRVRPLPPGSGTRSRAGSSRARTAFRRVLPATCCGSAATA